MIKIVNGQEVSLTAEEIAVFEQESQDALDKKPLKDLARLRRERDQLLAQSDWRDLPSYPGSNQEAWRTYRKALRDLPANTEDASNPTWPTAPETD